MTQDEIVIEEIITSFEKFALTDIEFNIERPIAAFILCSCFIDQLAAFRYNDLKEKNSVIYKRFIKDYLPQYKPLNLYVNLRCKLVHNYTVSSHIRLTNEEAPFENTGIGSNVKILTAKMMFNELKDVFERICKEFRTPDSYSRKNAIDRHRDSKIIVMTTHKITTYLEYESDMLIKYFRERLKDEFIYDHKKLKINSIDKKEMSDGRFLVIVNAKHGEEEINPQIDLLIQALNIETSTIVLNDLDPKK